MLKQISTDELIQEKFIDAMQDSPFYKIKVASFAKSIGISRSTFYFYYDSIYSVLESVEERFINGLVEENRYDLSAGVFNDPSALSAAMLRSSTEYLSNNLRTYRILSGPHGSTTFQNRMAARIKLLIDRIFSSFVFEAPEIQRKMIKEYIAGGQIFLLNWWSSQEHGVDLEALRDFDHRVVDTILSYAKLSV